jgi:hypothetical protein
MQSLILMRRRDAMSDQDQPGVDTGRDVRALRRQLREAEQAASAAIVQADMANRMLADVRDRER